MSDDLGKLTIGELMHRRQQQSAAEACRDAVLALAAGPVDTPETD